MSAKTFLVKAWMALFGSPRAPLVKELDRLIGPSCESLLDVGCGRDSPVRHLRVRPGRLVGVDGHLPAIEASCALGIHDEYHQISVLKIGELFGPGSFDGVLALEVIEHLNEEEAVALIAQMERLARRFVILSTPNGFFPQGDAGGNPFQVHRSGWTPEKLESMAYRVIGLGGWKCLRDEKAGMRWPPRFLWRVISLLSRRAVRDRPRRAFQILGVKDKGAGHLT